MATRAQLLRCNTKTQRMQQNWRQIVWLLTIKRSKLNLRKKMQELQWAKEEECASQKPSRLLNPMVQKRKRLQSKATLTKMYVWLKANPLQSTDRLLDTTRETSSRCCQHSVAVLMVKSTWPVAMVESLLWNSSKRDSSQSMTRFRRSFVSVISVASYRTTTTS